MNLLTRVFHNTSAQVLSRIISSGSGFLITLLIARFIGIAGYSDIAKITAFIGLLYLGIDLGANAIFLQFEKEKQNFQQLLSFRLLLALILFTGVCLITFFLPYDFVTTSGYSPLVKIGIIFFSLSFFTRAIVYSCSAIFQQAFAYRKATLATFGSSVITLLIVGLTVVLHLPLLWIIAGYFLGGVGEAVISLYLVGEKFYLPFPSTSFFKQLFFATLPLTILLFLNLIYFRVDMILLSFLQKATAVGLYDYAYKFFDFLIAFPLFLSNSLYPLLLQLEKKSRIQRKNISIYTLLFFGLGLLLVPFVWFAAPLIALVKSDFIPSVFALQLLALSLPVFFATNILQWIFITKKKQTFLVWIYGISLLLNIVLNVYFIPQYSYVASALITGFSELLILLVMVGYVFVNDL